MSILQPKESTIGWQIRSLGQKSKPTEKELAKGISSNFAIIALSCCARWRPEKKVVGTVTVLASIDIWAMLDQHFESSPKLLLFESTPWRRFLRWSKTTECGFLLPELEFLAVDSLAQPAMVSKSQLVDLIAREHLEGEANPMTQGQKEGTFNDPEGKVDARLTVGRICRWRLSVVSLNIHAARRKGAPDFKKSIYRIPSLAPAALNQRNNALEPRTIANLRIGHVVHARLGLVANGEKVARCLNSC